MSEMIILGEALVQQLFAMAPRAFGRSMTHWLWSERKHFLGNKKYRGEFRRSLDVKERKYGPGKWRKGIGSAFTGNVINRDQLDNLHLNMGITEKWQKRIPYADFLSRGGTILPKKAKWLIIPYYKNLGLRILGRLGSFIGSKRSYNKLFNFAAGNIEGNFPPGLKLRYPVFKNGRMYLFGNTSSETHRNKKGKVVRTKTGIGRLHDKLLFTGVKSVEVGKQYDFISDFERRRPIFVKNAYSMVEKTVAELDSGKIKIA
jgi:hypothetical protein